MKDAEAKKEEILRVSPFYRDEGFSYFCKYDELVGVIACPDVELPSINDSCYVDLSRQPSFSEKVK